MDVVGRVRRLQALYAGMQEPDEVGVRSEMIGTQGEGVTLGDRHHIPGEVTAEIEDRHHVRLAVEDPHHGHLSLHSVGDPLVDRFLQFLKSDPLTGWFVHGAEDAGVTAFAKRLRIARVLGAVAMSFEGVWVEHQPKVTGGPNRLSLTDFQKGSLGRPLSAGAPRPQLRFGPGDRSVSSSSGPKCADACVPVITPR